MKKEEIIEKIEKIKKGIASPATPENMKEAMKKKLEELEMLQDSAEKREKRIESLKEDLKETTDPKEKRNKKNLLGALKAGKAVIELNKERAAKQAEGLTEKSETKGVKSIVSDQPKGEDPDCDDLLKKHREKVKKAKERRENPPAKKSITTDLKEKSINYLKAIEKKMVKQGKVNISGLKEISSKMADLMKTVKKHLTGVESEKFIEDFRKLSEDIIAKYK